MTDTSRRTLELVEAIADELHAPYGTRAADTETRTLQTVEQIARAVGVLPPLPSSNMATKTFTIGTSSRDYSTITAWEADLDNGALYSAADDAVGECYADSAFNESATINGGGTVGLATRTLTAAPGEEHDGTTGTGVQITKSGGAANVLVIGIGDTTISWIEINSLGGSGFVSGVSSSGNYSNVYVHHMLVADLSDANNDGINLSGIGFRSTWVHGNIAYNVARNGIRFGSSTDAVCFNNTVYGSTTGFLSLANRANVDVRNNISMGCSTADFNWLGTTGTCDYNMSSDATADDGHASPPGNNLISKTASSQFVSLVGGSEDLHLKSGADAIDAGADIGTSPANVAIDVDGRDRDSQGDVWDIGADEFVSGGGGGFQAAWATIARQNSIIGGGM